MGIDRQHRKLQVDRDGVAFCAIPWVVLDSQAYLNLSHTARSLLIELVRQYKGGNNGCLLTSKKYLQARGWKSSDVIHRAKKELIEAGLIFETVKGRRPNRASWYALTWHALAKLNGYDAGVYRGFERSAYMKVTSAPRGRLRGLRTAPKKGVRQSPVTPLEGAIRTKKHNILCPPTGDHLDMPSVMH